MKKLSVILVLALLLLVFAGCEDVLSRIGQASQSQMQQQAGEASGKIDQKTTLTKEEAQAAAIAHAELTAADVTYLRSEYELDDGVPEWEIDFRSGDWEYDYTIHAETGAVRKWDKEYDPEKAPASATVQPEQTAPPTTAPAAPQRLTAAEAEAIALAHAKLTAEEVTGLRSEYDLDDGVPEYEIEFRSGRWEYDYTIHAETGAILKSEKDYND